MNFFERVDVSAANLRSDPSRIRRWALKSNANAGATARVLEQPYGGAVLADA